MRILYVSTISDTVNAFLIPHIKMLINKGHHVDVAYKIEQETSHEICNLGCTVHELNFNRNIFMNNYFKLINQVKKIVIDYSYDIVHTHTPIASAIVRLACKDLDNVKVIYTAHGFHFYKGAPLKNWLVYYPIEKYLSKFTDTIITINQEDYKRSKNFKAKKVSLVNGVGIDLDKFKPGKKNNNSLKNELNIASSDILLLSVGELNNNKNHQLIIRALAKLQNKNIHYLIIGEGDNKDYLSELLDKLGIANQVHLLGYRHNLSELYTQVDIFVFPSKREGLSAALMEAMASGLPVICSNIRGNKDLIDQNNGGYLINNKDIDEYARKINKLYRNEFLRSSFGSYNQIEITKYSLENVLKALKKIYEIN